MDFSQSRMLHQNRQEAISREFSVKKSVLLDEYYSKVTHDFSRYILIMLKTETKTLLEVMYLVSSYPGYECHREIRYQGDKISHLYAKFADSTSARHAARQIATDPLYTTEILSTILENWYYVEMLEEGLPWTLAVLDFVGAAGQTNPLDASEVNRLLMPFGDPRTFSHLTYPQPQAQMVQVLFSSMAEALGATIAFGQWCRGQQPTDSRFYRMRIIATKKEEALLRTCFSISNLDFLDLDYFLPSGRRGLPADSSPGDEGGSDPDDHQCAPPDLHPSDIGDDGTGFHYPGPIPHKYVQSREFRNSWQHRPRRRNGGIRRTRNSVHGGNLVQVQQMTHYSSQMQHYPSQMHHLV